MGKTIKRPRSKKSKKIIDAADESEKSITETSCTIYIFFYVIDSWRKL